jgi:hypothetical protein
VTLTLSGRHIESGRGGISADDRTQLCLVGGEDNGHHRNRIETPETKWLPVRIQVNMLCTADCERDK